MAALAQPEAEPIFEQEADGMAAWIYRFGSEQQCEMPTAADSGGQYLVVTAGELIRDGVVYDKWSTLFVTADEAQPTIAASANGLDLLVLQFPVLNQTK